eukprot:350552-Pyramimonas_sp.AAC.1
MVSPKAAAPAATPTSPKGFEETQQEALSIGGLASAASPPKASVAPPSANGAAVSREQISSSPSDDAHAAVVAEQQAVFSVFDDGIESYFDVVGKRDLDEEVEREGYDQSTGVDLADNGKGLQGVCWALKMESEIQCLSRERTRLDN